MFYQSQRPNLVFQPMFIRQWVVNLAVVFLLFAVSSADFVAAASLPIPAKSLPPIYLPLVLQDGYPAGVTASIVLPTPLPPPSATPTPLPTPFPTATATPVITAWRGEYFGNSTLTGVPSQVRNDGQVDFAWGLGAPALDLPPDQFSVRWSRGVYFATGLYRFHLLMDDGVRLAVDGQWVKEEWRDGSARELLVDLALAQGIHSLQIEYYEHVDEARAHFWWEPIGFTGWKGEYWSGSAFEGDPILVRNDAQINFAWGEAAPDIHLPADHFAVRWTRLVNFEAGLYRFTVRADDGVRVYLNDALILDEWHNSNADQNYIVDLQLEGSRRVIVEYYDQTVDALVAFAWQRVDQATPTWTPTSTLIPNATSTPLPTWTPTPTLTATPLVLPTR